MTRSDVNTLLNSLFGGGKMSKAAHRQTMDATLNYVDAVASPGGALADGSVTEAKLSAAVRLKLNQVGEGGGSTEREVYVASAYGAAGGANFLSGECPAGVDDWAILQGLCDIPGPKTIKFDGVFPITKTLQYDSDTTLDFGRAGGLVLRDGSNCDVLVNKNYSTVTGYYTVRNVEIINLRTNGNGFRSGAFRQSHHRPDGWNQGFRATGVEGLTMTNPRLRNSRTFSAEINNCRDVLILNLHIDQSKDAPYGNLDGIKILGPCDNVRIWGAHGFSQDDFLSCVGADIFWRTQAEVPGGGSESNTGVDVRTTWGPVTNCVFKDFAFEGTKQCLRIMSRNSPVDGVTFENIGGTTDRGLVLIDNFEIGDPQQTPLFLFDGASGDSQGNIGSLTFKNVNVTGNVSQGGLGFFALGGRIRDIKFIDCHYDNITSNESWLRFHPLALVDSCKVLGLSAHSLTTAAVDLLRSSGVVRHLELDHITYTRSEAANGSSIFRQEQGTTGHLQSNVLRSRNIGADISWAGGIIETMQSCGISRENDGLGLGHFDMGNHLIDSVTFSNFNKGVKTSVNGTISDPRGDAFGTTNTGGGGGGGGGGGDTPTDGGSTGTTSAYFTALANAVRANGNTVGTDLENRSKQAEITWKNIGVFSKLRVAYPNLGQSAATKGLNLLNPTSSDAAYRINYVGPHDFTGVGVKGSTATGTHAETYYAPSGKTPTGGRFFLLVSLEDGFGRRDFGATTTDGVTNFGGDQLHIRHTDGLTYYGMGTLPKGVAVPGSAIGIWAVTIDENRLVKLWKGKTIMDSYTATGTDQTGITMWLGNNHNADLSSDRRMNYLMMGAYPTDEQLFSLMDEITAILALQGINLPA